MNLATKALIAVSTASLTLGACQQADRSAKEGVQSTNSGVVDDTALTTPAGKDWLSWRGNLQGWGYSTLKQIDQNNVKDLALNWSVEMLSGSNETTPLVFNGILYLAQGGGTVRAYDARSGDLLWEYDRPVPADYAGPTGPQVRNLAIYGTTVYYASSDGHLIGLDHKTGDVVWDVVTDDYHNSAQTSGPIAVGGRVFTGRACSPTVPGGCFILANDAKTGAEVWRRYVVARPGEPGGDSWGGLPLEKRVHVGAWMPGSYDPKTNLLYWGTSVPAPSFEMLRGSKNSPMLYSNSTLALNPASGKIAWFFQHLPRDNWDFDHVFERMVVDSPAHPDEAETMARSPIKGPAVRDLLIGIPGKTGIIWALDRKTGQFIWARETVKQNVVQSIDPRTGAVTINESTIPKSVDESFGLICPSALSGGKDWPAGAYNPKLNALFFPLQNTCSHPTLSTKNPKPLDFNGLFFNEELTPEKTGIGSLHSYSAETGKLLWKYVQRAPMLSVVATEGGLIFAGDSDRRFRAFDAKTGKILWETVLNGPVSGYPITYSVNGVQYVAVTAGGGGDAITRRLNVLAKIPTPRGQNATLYVFALPGNVAQRDQTIPTPKAQVGGTRLSYTLAQADRGANLYKQNCARCHGDKMEGSMAPPLAGTGFLNAWGDKSVKSLISVAWSTMPFGAPKSLTQQQIADIVAHSARLNGHQPGTAELTPTTPKLGQTLLRPQKSSNP